MHSLLSWGLESLELNRHAFRIIFTVSQGSKHFHFVAIKSA